MMESYSIPYFWITVFLVYCMGSDFYKSKISNKSILISLAISLGVFIIFWKDFDVLESIKSLLLMILLGGLFFKFKILGGGDIKALILCSLFLTPYQLQNFLIFSLFWAAVYSCIYFLISGQILKIMFNTWGVYKRIALAEYKIPFTFGMFLGWLSLLRLNI